MHIVPCAAAELADAMNEPAHKVPGKPQIMRACTSTIAQLHKQSNHEPNHIHPTHQETSREQKRGDDTRAKRITHQRTSSHTAQDTTDQIASPLQRMELKTDSCVSRVPQGGTSKKHPDKQQSTGKHEGAGTSPHTGGYTRRTHTLISSSEQPIRAQPKQSETWLRSHGMRQGHKHILHTTSTHHCQFPWIVHRKRERKVVPDFEHLIEEHRDLGVGLLSIWRAPSGPSPARLVQSPICEFGLLVSLDPYLHASIM